MLSVSSDTSKIPQDSEGYDKSFFAVTFLLKHVFINNLRYLLKILEKHDVPGDFPSDARILL